MALDGEHHRLTLRHGEETYTLPMLHDSVFNIYNELAAVAVRSEMGLSMEEICAALEATPLTKTRLDQIQVKGVAVVSMMAKSNNSLPVSMVFDYIRRKPGKKAVILALDDLDESKSSERIGWIYDTDYEFLNDESIVQILATGVRCWDHQVRLLLAGVPREKLVCKQDELQPVGDGHGEDPQGIGGRAMTIEFLYPELCNLYGDRGNMDYLRRCLPADTRQTYMGDEPWFVQHEVDLIYMCSMTERSQERIIQALAPYRERLKDLMAGGTHFLLTGNAMEVFGKTIRANALFLGGFEGTKIVGYTSRFSHMESSLPPLFTVEKGLGRSESAAVEGIRSGGVLGTYLLGPLLVLNPDFTRWLLDDLGAKDAPLAFETEVRQAYRARLEQFQGNIEV